MRESEVIFHALSTAVLRGGETTLAALIQIRRYGSISSSHSLPVLMALGGENQDIWKPKDNISLLRSEEHMG